MKKKDISFAEEAQRIESKYYKIRKAGDDKMTDEAFNREMQQLMEKQESVKQAMQSQSPQISGGLEQQSPQGMNHEQLMSGIGGQQQFKNGGNLPQYSGFKPYSSFLNPNVGKGGLDYDSSNFGQDAFKQQGFNANITPETNFVNPSATSLGSTPEATGGNFSPTANILGPLLTTATSAISSKILADNLDKHKNNLLNGIGVNLGRINPQQIDLGRERANIRSNAALTESSGRYASKGARSASEAAMIQNMARIGGQRVSGDQLSQSYGREELTNADLRQKAAEINMQNAGRENMMEQQQRMDIESQYGGAGSRIWSDFAKSTGQSIGNYMNESQRMKRDYDYMQMAAPNMEMDYQTEFNKLSPTMQKLARLGIYTPGKNIKVR